MVNHSITLAATDLFRENTSFLTAVLETGDGLDSSLSPTADIALSLYLAILSKSIHPNFLKSVTSHAYQETLIEG